MFKKIAYALFGLVLSFGLFCSCESTAPKQEEQPPVEETQAVVIHSFDNDGTGCGWRGSNGKGSQKNKVEWLESYEGKTGVLKMIGAQGSIYRNFYFEASSNWTNETLHSYITENDGANWDYIVVSVWISSVSHNPIENACMDDYMQTLYVNEWQEIKIPKAYFNDNKSTHKSIDKIADGFTTNNEYLFFIRTQDDADTSNVMIYVDEIRFESDGE